jgi:hypothetical protein
MTGQGQAFRIFYPHHITEQHLILFSHTGFRGGNFLPARRRRRKFLKNFFVGFVD